MKLRKGLAACLLIALAGATAAATPNPDAAQLERIRTEQRDVQARYAKAAAACGKEFAVTDCVDRARAERRAALDRLKRERLAIDDARRQRSAAAREQKVQRKAAVAADQAASAAARARARADGSANDEPQGAAGPGYATRALKPSTQQAAPKPAVRTHDHTLATRQAAQQAAKRASDAQLRNEKAEQHRKDVAKRLAEKAQKRPAAAGLPVPPAGAGSAASR